MGNTSYLIESEGKYLHIRGTELPIMKEVAKAIWSKVPEHRPTVHVILEGASRPIAVYRGGAFRKLWDGSWVRIIRDENGKRY